MIDLSVIIVNWNARDLLQRCLQDVYGTTEGLAFEVILVDNASTDGSVEMVRGEFPQVLLIENRENVGFARANNQAIRESQARYVLLLNSDAFLTGKAVHNMIEVLEANLGVGIAGARLVFPDGQPQLSHGPLPTIYSEFMSLFGLDKYLPRRNQDPSITFVETGTVVGACLMVRRSMLDQIGLLDENYFFFSEEVDLCRRAHRVGWKVVHVPGAKVIHIGGGSSGNTPNRMLILYREKLRYFGKHKGRASQEILLMGIWLATLIKLVGYFVLRVLTLGRVQKDFFWLRVVKGLPQLGTEWV